MAWGGNDDLRSIGRAAAISYKGAAEDYSSAFRPLTGKMFALVALDEAPLRLTLKCDPVEADFFRSIYS